jgi:ribonuclease Z
MPPRQGQVGFVYAAPYRIQGASVAGEHTAVQVPELDVTFDIGSCPRHVLSSPFVALTHGHMDHVGGLPYYFSQRMFQQMGVGTCVCHAELAGPLERMMCAWIDVEQQRTEHRIVGLEPDGEIEVKPHVVLRAIEVSHRVPAFGYALVEMRSKLREEFRDYPQDKLRDLRLSGTEITRVHQIPLVAYTGDTETGPFLYRDEFAQARVVIAECTFIESEHRSRASIGRHLHIEDIRALMQVWAAEHIVLVHLSRRTNLTQARERIDDVLGEDARRVHLLMDHRANRQRYDRLRAEAEPTSDES